MNDDQQKCDEASKGLSDLRDSIAKLTRVPRVLIVEDDPADVLALTQAIVNVAKCDVTSASSVAEALFLFERQPFDAVFLDLVIPGADGLDFLRKVSCPNVVVVVTGQGSDAPIIEEAMRLGAVMVISKPVQEQDLRKIFGGVYGC